MWYKEQKVGLAEAFSRIVDFLEETKGDVSGDVRGASLLRILPFLRKVSFLRALGPVRGAVRGGRPF